MTRSQWFCWLALMLAAFLAGLATVRRPAERVPASSSQASADPAASAEMSADAPDPAMTVERRLEEKLAAALAARQPRVPEDFAGPFSGEHLLELAAQTPRDDRAAHDDISRYAMAWARHDPAGMWAYFARRGSFSIPLGPQSPASRNVLGVAGYLLPGWLERDRDACLAAAKAAPRGLLNETDVHQLSGALWKDAPAEALELLAQKVEGKMALGTDWFQLGELSEEQTRERFAQVLGLPEGEVRSRLTAAFLLGPFRHAGLKQELWTGLGAAEQAALFEAGYAPASDQPGYEEGFQRARAQAEAEPSPVAAADFVRWHGVEWVRKDLPAALAWAKTHLSGESRSREVATLFQMGFENAPEVAARELAQIPESSWRDAVLGSMARRHMGMGQEEKLREQPWFKILSEEERAAAIKWANWANGSPR